MIDYTKENFDPNKETENYYKLLANPSLFNKMINEKYDCTIACNHNAPSYFASYITDTPKVVWIRGDLKELDYKIYNPLTVEYSRIKQEYNMQNSVFKLFDNIVVISDKVKSYLKEYFNIEKNVYKISNSIDKDKIIQLSNYKIKEIKENEKTNITIFTTLGRLDENKNQILLLKAAKILIQKNKNFIIYVLGDGEQKSNLQEYINKNKLNDNVKIIGFVDNPYPYIKNSTATITTSLSEGFSLVLAESVF